jgi:hypothetical protein
MNWKEEGYKVGEKALIVREEIFEQASYDYFYMEEVDIVHVGTKILKIKRKRHKEIIETEDLTIKDNGNGVVFRLYKNKESYDLAVAEKLEKEKLLHKVRDKLKDLNINQLMAIVKLIES